MSQAFDDVSWGCDVDLVVGTDDRNQFEERVGVQLVRDPRTDGDEPVIQCFLDVAEQGTKR